MVSEIFCSRVRIRWRSVHRRVLGLWEETPFSKTSRTLEHAGQVRIVCSNDSDSFSAAGAGCVRVLVEPEAVGDLVSFCN